jgi:hypothetical protein
MSAFRACVWSVRPGAPGRPGPLGTRVPGLWPCRGSPPWSWMMTRCASSPSSPLLLALVGPGASGRSGAPGLGPGALGGSGHLVCGRASARAVDPLRGRGDDQVRQLPVLLMPSGLDEARRYGPPWASGLWHCRWLWPWIRSVAVDDQAGQLPVLPAPAGKGEARRSGPSCWAPGLCPWRGPLRGRGP